MIVLNDTRVKISPKHAAKLRELRTLDAYLRDCVVDSRIECHVRSLVLAVHKTPELEIEEDEELK